jgi:hypothetical protein
MLAFASLVGVSSALSNIAACKMPPPKPPAAVRPVEGISRLMPVLPTLKISGSTTGSGTAKAALEFRLGLSNDVDISISPTGSLATTSGVSTLIAAVNEASTGLFAKQQNAPAESNAWKLGGVIAISWSDLKQTKWEQERRDSVHLAAYCACDGRDESGKPIEFPPNDVNATGFCKNGQAIVLASDRDTNDYVQYAIKKYRYPVLDVSAWGGFGASLFSYFQPAGGQIVKSPPNAATVYDATSSIQDNDAFAFEAVYVDQSGEDYALTVDVPATLQRAPKAASDVAQACVTSGMYNKAPLLNCNQAPLGAPKIQWTGGLGLGLGVVDKKNGAWRAALTPAFSYTGGTNSSMTFAMSLPVYLNVATFGAGKDAKTASGLFSGVVAIAPTVQTVETPGKENALQFSITITLLAQRTLFTRADSLLQ